MLVYFFVVILAVLLSMFDTKSGYGLKAAFVLITVFLGIRYMYGSDYPAYLALFNQYSSDGIPLLDFAGMMESDIYGEIGWQILNKLFAPFGFFAMYLALAVFENIVIYKLIKRYVPPRYYWLSVIIYLLNTRFFLIGACSMARQWLAVCVFICAVKYIEEKKLIPYVILVLLASSFHKSAIILLPFYFISYLKEIRFKTIHAILFFVLLIIWNFAVKRIFGPVMDMFAMEEDLLLSDFARYAEWDVETESFTLVGFIVDVFFSYLFPFLGFVYYSKLEQNTRLLLLLYLAVLIIKPIGSSLPMASRLDYFFIIFSICIIPIILSVLDNKNNRLIVGFMALFIVAIFVRQTYGFLTSSVWAKSYIYKTILTQPWV